MLLSRRFVEKKRNHQKDELPAQRAKSQNNNSNLTELLDTVVKILGIGSLADNLKDYKENSDLKLEASGIYDSLANRKVVKNSLDYAKQVLSESGYKLKDPPLAAYKAKIDALEPIYFKTANTLWILPDYNVKIMESVFPKFLPKTISNNLIKTANACCELLVSMSMIPSGIAYMGLFYLANKGDDRDANKCVEISMKDLGNKKHTLSNEESAAFGDFAAGSKIRPVCRSPA